MPTRSVSDEYALWLATPPTTGILVETLEITGPAIINPIRICNRKDKPLVAGDENGMPVTFIPLAFTMSKPAIRNSSEYQSVARLDGIQGQLLQIFSRIQAGDLDQPVFVVARLYVDPTMIARPVWAAPLRFRCEQAQITFDVLELTLVGGRMPTKRAGGYYTLERFEGIKPF